MTTATRQNILTGPDANGAEKEIEDRPVSIEVRDLHKTFRIPEHRVDSIKERSVHPFRRMEYRELNALDGVSFEVHQGEFFGIVGRNGSGKSTLLKILASIYRADSGRIRMAGRLAPFIELGVGFNMDLNARENIVLNAVMMGISRRDAATRVDRVLEFAELEEFEELKLKNYSSGMMVRLAFSTMLEADADIMLIDEVLAVGDAAFAQKCEDVFHEMRDSGKTVVLVSHDMGSVEKFCHRAMLIEDGEIKMLGDPEEIASEYMRLNFDGGHQSPAPGHSAENDSVKVLDAWLENDAGDRIANLEMGQKVRMRLSFEAFEDIPRPMISCVFSNAEGHHVVGFVEKLTDSDGKIDVLEAGRTLTIATDFDNNLMPGRYYVSLKICRNATDGDMALRVLNLLNFVVFGTSLAPGLVTAEMEHRIEIGQARQDRSS